MSCCPTFELNALEATGNLASGQTDLVNNAVLKAFIARQPHPSVPLCCPTVPFISPYAGGNSSGGLSVGLLRQQQFCDASQNLAIAKLQQTNSTTQRFTTPGLTVGPRFTVSGTLLPIPRFQQYNRPPAFMPCPRVTNNAGMPAAVNGPCTNVINFIQTWPPS
jgi:hypothetical protein